ncbi:hypothetical protein NOCARDAX2BIS_210021 [Nocardioides sp. AX2bis]|nr:hypothetical protein NOCARDAX2BIS_210021 [Nocardioides sp. AX2bis]
MTLAALAPRPPRVLRSLLDHRGSGSRDARFARSSTTGGVLVS